MHGIFAKYSINSLHVMFEYDNNPKHMSKSIKSWLTNQPFHVMEWPAQFLNMKPIKHLYIR